MLEKNSDNLTSSDSDKPYSENSSSGQNITYETSDEKTFIEKNTEKAMVKGDV